MGSDPMTRSDSWGLTPIPVIARHELLAHPSAFAIDLIVCCPEAAQHGFGHCQRHFALAGKDPLGARPPK